MGVNVQFHLSQFPTEASRSRKGSPSVLSKTDRNESGVKPKQDAANGFRVLIVDRDSMSSDLLANALTRERNCRASAVASADVLLNLEADRAGLVVIGAELTRESRNGFDLAQTVCRAHPGILIVILLNQSTHESVVNAFRSGARGIFSRQQPMADFLDCIDHVRKGFIWAGAHETTLLLDALRCIPSPDMTMADESSPLTARELEVVRCAATGKTNKVIAAELGLSEHTVKNYLFRSFEKLGVSNRVELLFYLTLKGHTFGPSLADDPEADLRAG
jgi:two-component system, NarL family, nitrate/nitrite response regulator NarL